MTGQANTAAVLLLCAGAALGAQWTVGVYMCADNELLNNRAYEDLVEMMAVGSTEDVDVIVQVDNVARDTHPECRRYRVVQGGFEPLGEMGEVDMADSATLRGFAEFLRDRYPARNYFLVLWDHGTGWREGYGPRETGFRTQAIIQDDSHGHMMGVSGGEFRRALAGVREALGRRVRVLGMDACLMQAVEVGWEARDVCDYVLASEATVPATGWPYDRLLELLTENPRLDVEELLVRACSTYVAHYTGQSECMSAVNTRRLVEAVEELRNELGQMSPDLSGFREARAKVQTFTTSGRPCPQDDQVDLIHFFALASGLGADRIEREFSKAVEANAASGDLANARGLSVWFPDRYLDFKNSLGSYAGLEFARTTAPGRTRAAWPGFLGAYFGYDDNKPSSVGVLGHGLTGGDLRLWWQRAFDPSPVLYDLYEFSSRSEVFGDGCDTVSAWWRADGWTASDRHYTSGPRSFHSGSGDNLDNRLTLRQPLRFDNAGLLTFSAFHDTEESQDSATGNFKRDVCYVEWSEDTLEEPAGQWRILDSLYGRSDGWLDLGYLLPVSRVVAARTGELCLRFRYKTDGTVSRLGVFIDDIRVDALGRSRAYPQDNPVAAALRDTQVVLTDVSRGVKLYCVAVRDSHGNLSSVSDLYELAVEEHAEPYSIPAPFQDSCMIVVDFPAGTEVELRIHTLSGALVRTLKPDPGMLRPGHAVHWDGRNEAGESVAAGLYLVAVRGEGYSRVGRVAKTGR